MAWNSSSATTTRRPLVSASRAGRAKISGASRETSLAERTAGKATDTAEAPPGSVSSRTSGRVAPMASRIQDSARETRVSAARTALA